MEDSTFPNTAPHFCRELSLVGTVHDLPRIAQFVEEITRDAGLDPALCENLQLVIDEACCNVFEHAYAGQPGALHLRFELKSSDAVVTLRDQGIPFDPEEIQPADISLPLAERPIGGLGVFIMGQLVDDLRYDFSDAGNTLTMIKRDAVPGAAQDG